MLNLSSPVQGRCSYGIEIEWFLYSMKIDLK